MRRRMTLRDQLLMLQVVIVLITVVGTGAVAFLSQQHQLRSNYQDRMVGVARQVATNPVILAAFNDADPSQVIQPITELISKSSGIAYAVVMNADGIRYSHPDPGKIGKHVSTDPEEVLSGDMYVGTQTGTMGTSWRVKVPIFNPEHEVIGAVSVGVLESDMRNEYLANAAWLFITIGIAAIFGVVGAAWVTVVIRRRIFGLEPEEIAGLLDEREAILHGVREGVLAVDENGRIALVNDAAVRLLSLGGRTELVGRPARDTLEPALVELLEGDGAEQSLILSGERVLLVRRDVARIGGREIGAILILRDNTELHTLMRDLDGVQGLADGLRAQAHGFANKLHVISGLLELGRVEQAVSFISHERSGGALTRLAGQSGISEVEVAALLLMKQVRADELGIDISVSDDSVLPALAATARGEALREDLLTITGNLIDNAVEATGTGGRISVSVALAGGSGGRLLVSVADSGEGIAPQLRERVFAAGYSSKAALPGAVSTGRGIGLTLVKRIAARHGGTVSIGDGLPTTGGLSVAPEGGAGLGARITVELPIPAGAIFAAPAHHAGVNQ
ncbi:two-component system CitB family sensor kinase [Arthrobacter stackebrandtii]|uniref:histidine kinase n=1 Tax=Arthrobacter stackebrandtii TaxID=272161 RepID=A0ABS4YSL0_9MICC|nr:sensor histidine kinase [Arthrobacter stackebrandtii]MBP2411774.1 two-component system CitB family sensor kinase [Arthrobacter stackebrandtii]